MKQTSAILVGFNGDDLRLAERDPILLREVLERDLGFWIPDVAIGVGEKATLRQIRTAASAISEEEPIGLLFFFAGHGTLDAGQNHIELADGLYSLEEVTKAILGVSPDLCRLVMILDACRVLRGSRHSGAGFSADGFTQDFIGLGSDPASRPILGRSRPAIAYLFGCEWGRTSYEHRSAEQGVFTGAFLSAIESAESSDLLLLTDLVKRIEMPDGQQATVIDGHGLGLRTLGSPQPHPPKNKFDSAIDWLACCGPRSSCLTVSGSLAISASGRSWKPVKGGPYRSAGLAGESHFAHSDDFLRYRGGGKSHKMPLLDPIRHFVVSSSGRWLAALPGPQSRYHTRLFDADDTSEPAFLLDIPGIQHLAFLDEIEQLLVAESSGRLLLHEPRSNASTSVMEGAANMGRLATSADGKWAAWCDWGGRFWIWNHYRERIEEIDLHSPVTAIAFGGGGVLAVGQAQGKVLLRQADNRGGAFQELILTPGIVTALAFASGDRYLMVGNSRGHVLPVAINTGLKAKGRGMG